MSTGPARVLACVFVSVVAAGCSRPLGRANVPAEPPPPAREAAEAAEAAEAPKAPKARARRRTSPLVRPVRWLCEEQECEDAPVFAYDYLPAVSADKEHVAIVEERDGWWHTPVPGVRVVSASTGASERFFPVVDRSIDLHRDLSRKTEVEAMVRAANDGLAAYDWLPLFPPDDEEQEPADEVSKQEGSRRRGRARYRVAGLRIEVWSADAAPPLDRLDEVVIRDGATTHLVSARDWDPQSGCSRRGFRLVGARRDAKAAVFVSEIAMTGHNCDGVDEKQPWAVRVVRW